MIKTHITYETSDGEVFTDKAKAEEHESYLETLYKNVRAYHVSYSPDLTEGHGYECDGYVLVHAKCCHELFLKHWLGEEFGNPIALVGGVYGSNAIMDRYVYKEVPYEQVDTSKVLKRLEEKFVEKLWVK